MYNGLYFTYKKLIFYDMEEASNCKYAIGNPVVNAEWIEGVMTVLKKDLKKVVLQKQLTRMLCYAKLCVDIILKC